MPVRRLPETRVHRAVLVGILIVFAILATVFSIRVPIFEASDELWHYPMVEVIARTWTLPVQPTEPGTTSGPWRQEGSQQPLYYALGAALTSWIDTADMPEVRQVNPHARAGEITPDRDNANLVIHHPDREGFPWTGTVLAVHVVRLLSVALGTWAVYLTWALVAELFPSQPWIALTSAAVHAFTPMFLFISSSVNNDNLIVPLCTWALLLMLRRVRSAGEMPTFAHALNSFSLGVVVALALLTKTSALGLLPFVVATLAWEAWRLPETVSWGRRLLITLKHALLTTLPIIVISGWWYARNVRLYGDLLGWSAFGAVLGTRDVPASLGQLWAERMAFAAGYWGNFGGLNVPMPDWVTTTLNGVTVVAAAGLLVRLVAWIAGRGRAGCELPGPDGAPVPLARRLWPLAWTSATAVHALAWAWPVAILVSWVRWATITWSSQGRLIFPAISLWSLALVLGLSAWVPSRRRGDTSTPARAVPAVALAGLLLTLCLAALPAWIDPAYRPPPAIADAGLPAGYTPVGARFGEALVLLGYRVESAGVSPDGDVTIGLVWQSVGETATYHSVFIHLLGEGERIVAQRDTFPGHGHLPTVGLSAGRTWVEQHRLAIPHTAYTPDDLTVAVGVYETLRGTRILPDVGDGDSIRFGQVPLVGSGGSPNRIDLRFGDAIVLESYDISALAASPGDEVTVDLTWRCIGPVDHDYTVSVQLIDSRWNKASQSDAWPLDGARPTTSWQPGEVIHESRTLTVAPDAPSSAYSLRLALYRATPEGELEHLPVSQSRQGMPAKAIELTTVRVRE